jgi:hypothetical protein
VYVWLQSMCTRDGVNPISFWKRTHDPEQSQLYFVNVFFPAQMLQILVFYNYQEILAVVDRFRWLINI